MKNNYDNSDKKKEKEKEKNKDAIKENSNFKFLKIANLVPDNKVYFEHKELIHKGFNLN